MKDNNIEIKYQSFDNIAELSPDDAALLDRAKAATADAYAPYSKFRVGAAARLANGKFVAGSNQENASYPVGNCAERVLLGNAATLYPGVSIDTLAISYEGDGVLSDHPISPCGMCRQALLEYEARTSHPIRLILGGKEGEVFVIKSASNLLPFAFTPTELG